MSHATLILTANGEWQFLRFDMRGVTCIEWIRISLSGMNCNNGRGQPAQENGNSSCKSVDVLKKKTICFVN